MAERQAQPVIMGSSMTGLLVSYTLSKNHIPHILIGSGVPPNTPRLGESMNECASTELWRLFGDELIDYFHVKSHISLLNGPFATMAYLAEPKRRLQQKFDMNGGTWTGNYVGFMADLLMHVDRAEFDRAVYERVRAESACTFIEAQVAGIQYDVASDAVVGLTLSDGTVIENPKYVFDCTGPRCLVGEAAGVGTEVLSDRQRVVWTHYMAEQQSVAEPDWWSYGTNLLRLEESIDGIDGISWLIPLGDKISVGISADNDRYGDAKMNGARVLELLAEAYARRGVNYLSSFPDVHPAIDMNHQYSIRDRAYGANWLLAGGGFVQIWFPSSAGLWTTTAASELAPKLIESPLEVGAEYERMMRNLLKFHDHLERMIHGDAFRSHGDAYRFWSGWMGFIPERLADHMRISRPKSLWDRIVERSFRRGTRLVGLFPRAFLIFGGMLTVYVRREDNLAQQSDAFPNYHVPRRFRVLSYLKGLPHMARSI